MSNQIPVFDMTADEKRTELISLGFEKEVQYQIQQNDETKLSTMLVNARSHPRPMHGGLLLLPSAEETVDMVRPKLANLKLSESFISTSTATAGQEEKITFTRLSELDTRAKLSLQVVPSQRVLKCPRCDAPLHLYYKRATSDGNCGIEYATHVCTDTSCGLHIDRYYEGYGTIFE